MEYQSGKLKLRDKHGYEYLFEDAAHRKLTRIVDANGNETVITYTGDVHVRIQDDFGGKIGLTWMNSNAGNGVSSGVYLLQLEAIPTMGGAKFVHTPKNDPLAITTTCSP